MSEEKLEKKKRIAFLLIHYILILLFIFLSFIALWYELFEFILFNSALGIVVYIESVKFLPKDYFKDDDVDS